MWLLDGSNHDMIREWNRVKSIINGEASHQNQQEPEFGNQEVDNQGVCNQGMEANSQEYKTEAI